MNNKENNLKEKLRQVLTSTAKAISGDLKVNDELDKNKNLKKFDFFNLENLNSKSDFLKARAESDSNALKKKFSNVKIFNKNSPSNSSYKSLYFITEKIRYESLGFKILKGIEKNIKNNYKDTLDLKKKINLRPKMMFL